MQYNTQVNRAVWRIVGTIFLLLALIGGIFLAGTYIGEQYYIQNHCFNYYSTSWHQTIKICGIPHDFVPANYNE